MDDATLSIGDSFTAMTLVTPMFKKTPAYTLTSSSNAVVVDGDSLRAVSNGTATITMQSVDFSDSYDVTVKDITYQGLTARTYTDIALARIPTSIEIGDEFSCQAYALSAVTADHPYKYGQPDENIVSFSSSNPSVCSVKNGVLLGVSQGTATITVTAGSVQKSFIVSVVPATELDYDTIHDLTVSFDVTDAEECTQGIIDLLNSASLSGYKYVRFPKDVYYVSPAYGSIYIPTEMIVDFDGSIVQIEESSLTSTGYNMFVFADTEYSEIRNATIYGERYLIDYFGAEGCECVKFRGYNYKSGLRDCTVSRSPGFNIHVGYSNRKVVGCPYSSIEEGGLDASGQPVSASYSYRTSTYVNISSLGDEIALGNMQGYQGYMYMSARVYDLCFYDTSHNFISKLENCIQYYMYPKPANAKYAKIAYNYGSAPTGGDPDYHAIAHFYSMEMQKNCYVKDCIFEDCWSTAIVPNIGETFLIDGCTFRHNGYRDPSSQIDWEDGRNNIKGHIVRNCTFYYGGAVSLVGGDGIVLHNNLFNNNMLKIHGEVQNSRVWLNQFFQSTIQITTKTDMVFSQNIGVESTCTLTDISDVNFKIRTSENSGLS